MYQFGYSRPASVAEATAAASRDGEARFLAGGQTLIPVLRMRLAKPTALVDLNRIAELKGIKETGNAIVIGAMTTHAEVAGSPTVKKKIPALAHLASEVGDPAVRHRGTLGGSLANNDPAADYPAGVLALGATVITNKRQIKADDFFVALFRTALEPGELITAVSFPVPERAGYEKFQQRASRFALVGVFVAKTGSEVRVAVTGAGEGGVFRQGTIESALKKSFSADAVAGANVAIKWLVSDLHGSAEYRGALISVMAERAVTAAPG